MKAKTNWGKPYTCSVIAAVITGLLLLLLPLISRTAYAAPSTNLNFQARLASSTGSVVPDGNYHIEFKLYNLSSGGSALWTETRTTGNLVQIVNGYLTVNLGSVNTFPTSINWNEEHWLTMNIGGTGGVASWDGEMNPRLKLTAVPYAFQASQLAKTSGVNRGTLSFNTVANNPAIDLPDASGTVCLQNATDCGFASSSGSGNYIQNSTALQANANLAIQSVGDANVAALIRARSSQTADLLQFQNSAGTNPLSGINSAGNLYYRDGASGFVATLGLAGLSSDRSILLPNAGGTICTTAGNCIGNGGAGDIFNGGQAGPITIGTNDNTTFTLETNNSPAITILGNSNVGIGAATAPAATLEVRKTITNISGDVALISPVFSVTSAGNYAYNGLKVAGSVIVDDTYTGTANGTFTELTALDTGGNFQGVARGQYVAVLGHPTLSLGSGAQLLGQSIIARNQALNTDPTLTGSYISVEGRSTTSYGVRINVGTYSLQSAADAFGLYIDDVQVQASGDQYAIYQVGTNDQNYFAGNVGIGTTAPSALLSVGGATGNLTVDTSGNLITAGTLTVNGTNFTNAGSTLYSGTALGNFATGGSIGTAAATVDIKTSFTIAQTTANQTITVPSPTNTAAGRVIYISNVGTTSFTLLGVTVNNSSTATLVWNGTAWTFAGADGSSILNQRNIDQNAHFRISGTGQANTAFISPVYKSSDSQGSSNSANVTLQSGDANTGNNNGSGTVTIKSGDSTNGNNGSSGSIVIDAGAKSGTGTAGSISLGATNASAILLGRSGITTTINGSLTVATGSTFTNSSSTLFTAIAITNKATGGNIGTAATTVDVATTFDVSQTTAGQTLTLPSPTVTTAGRIAFVSNVGTVSFTMYGVIISPSTTSIYFWNGTLWTPAGVDGSGANYIQNQNSADQTANFRISGSGQAGGGFTGPSLDVAAAGTLSVGTGANNNAITLGRAGVTTTNAGALTVTELTTLNGNLTIETGDTFTFNGDAFTDLTGTGLTVSGGSLQTTLGTSVDLASAEVTGILGVTNGGTGTNTQFTQGSIVFAGASGVYTQDNSNFYFDDTNNTIGIGTTRSGAIDGTGNSRVVIQGSGSTSSTSALNIRNSSGSGSIFLVRDDGNVGIGTTAPGKTLDVAGSTRILATSGTNGNGSFIWDGTTNLLNYQGADVASTTYAFFGTNRTYTGSAWTSTGFYGARAGATLQVENDALAFYQFAASSNTPVQAFRIATGGNVGIGTSIFGTSAAGILALGQATAPSTSPADNVQLYVTDAGAGDSRLRVRMEGGGVVTFPNETGTICTTGSVCAGYAAAATNGYVQFAPTTVQADTTTNSSIFINKTGASGNILQLQKSGVDKLVIDNSGNVGIGDTSPNSLFTVGDNDLFQINSTGQIGAQTASFSDYLFSLAGSTANDYSRVIDITQANDSNENSTVINIANTANTGTISAANRNIYNMDLSLTPTATLSTATVATLNTAGIRQTVNLSNVTLGNSGTSDVNTLNAYGNQISLTGSPVYNDTTLNDQTIFSAYGHYSAISLIPTLTSVRPNSTFDSYGGYFSNGSGSAGNANLVANSYGIYASAIGGLTTTGNTAHYGGYFRAGGTADNNYGIFISDITGATNNYSLYSSGTSNSYFAGNVGIGTTSPTTAKLEVVVPAGGNVQGMQITQSDTTNNPRGLSIINSGTANSLFIQPNGNTSASTSAGGAILLDNTNNTGAGMVIYSNQAAPTGHLLSVRADSSSFNQSGIYLSYAGTANALNIVNNSTSSTGGSLNVTSSNPNESTLKLTGQETGKGTIKITHTGTGTDANASAISISLAGTGTASQGIFLDAPDGGTTGKLLNLRNNGSEVMTLDSASLLKISKSVTGVQNFINLQGTGAFSGSEPALVFSNSAGNVETARISSKPGTSYTNSLFTISTADASKALQPRLSIDVNGNVGIGTTVPTASLSLGGEVSRTIRMEARTGNTAGNNLTIAAGGGGAGASAVAGGQLILQGGAAAGSGAAANGGVVTISGGAGIGTGTQGLVNLSTTAFTSASVQTFAASGSITAGNIDLYSTLPITASSTSVVVTVPDPAQNVIGRLVYIAARSGSNDFTLRFNSARIPIDIAMKANSTATLIWNGTDWTAAGASSSTDLQSAYNNTLTSAGGAELVLNASGGAADGLTIRNNATTPISGGILEVQSSIGTNLFSVNNFGTELAANGGSETSSTFATNWTAAPAGGTVTRTTTAGQFVTGLAGAQVVTTTTANTGIRNNLSGNPVNTIGAVYQVSFTAKSSLNGTAIDVQYSRNGGTNMTACTNYGAAGAQTLSNTVWTKITCTITIDSATAATDPDLYIRKTDAATAPTIYIDNLSFIRNDTTTQPSNVQVGGGINGGPVTLFTLDRSSAPPVANGNTTYYGSMYYDTTTGRIQCYESDGWGACGSAPDNIITLTPEYTGAVLNGTGIGVMTADFCGNGGGLAVNTSFCASGEARNYYRWTSPQATDQTYSIYVNYKLPSTFKEFIDDNTIKLTAFKDHATNAGATLDVYRKDVNSGTISQCGSSTTITTGTGAWNTTPLGGLGEQSSCGFVAGDYVIFKITVTAKNAANVYIENLDFTYTNK